MPIIRDFTLPVSAQLLDLPEISNAKFFIAFISSDSPVIKQPWRADVCTALRYIDTAFSAETTLKVAIVPNIPALIVRFKHIDNKITATRKLIKGEILDKARLISFLT
ncbi:hypothetical protein N7493_006973 [Penicillium malachiteum]|uniref:Uncharacterized protein n=1 Tax=Penicillium malachiteum TaxID=1324776 RepID=A0AAD6HJW8_9EURO|nr:hypothetical protein N7493_006973 [Penicillium malachiteum]